jgi:hypothetical protein
MVKAGKQSKAEKRIVQRTPEGINRAILCLGESTSSLSIRKALLSQSYFSKNGVFGNFDSFRFWLRELNPYRWRIHDLSFESNLSPIAPEYRTKRSSTTQSPPIRINEIVNRLRFRDQGVGGSNPLAPTILPK